MTALPLTITQAGLMRYTAAQLGDDVDLSVSSVGLTAAEFVAAPTLTVLPGEFRRLTTISGDQVGDSIVHMIIRDAEALAYTVRGLGLFLADGTLFATYGQADAIFEKSTRSDMHLAIDIAFPTGDTTLLTFGDTNFLLPPATTEREGVAEIATEAEVTAGTDTRRYVSPFTLARRLAALLAGYMPAGRRVDTAGLALGGGALTTDRTISVPAATGEQLRSATATNAAVTPASFGALGNIIGPTGSYTLPGGRIDKWGKHRQRANSEITVQITFETPFPTACYSVSLTPFISAPTTNDDYFVQLAGEPTREGFVVQYASDDDNGGLSGFDWQATGA